MEKREEKMARARDTNSSLLYLPFNKPNDFFPFYCSIRIVYSPLRGVRLAMSFILNN
jgi:hypothetical protein